MNAVKKFMYPILFCACGAAILLVEGFWNGYPFVMSDTGSYLANGFTSSVPTDRPITYGLFLRYLSFKETLWLPVFFQGVFLSYLLYKLVKHIFGSAISYSIIIFLLIFLVAFTSVSWYSSELLPDIFAAISFLSLAVLLICEFKNRTEYIFVILLFLFSLLMHSSYLLIFTMFLPVLFFYYRKKTGFENKALFRKKFLVVITVVVSSWFILPFINYLVDGKYRIESSSHIFLTARLSESGILGHYLLQECRIVKTPGEINDREQYSIIAKSSSKCLDITENSSKDGALLQQWDFARGENQKFNIIKVSDNAWKIVAVHSGKCLETFFDTTDGTSKIHQENFAGKENQKFNFHEAGNGLFQITGSDGKVFDVYQNNLLNGAIIREWNPVNNDNQKFQIINSSENILCFHLNELPNNASVFIWDGSGLVNRLNAREDSSIIRDFKSILTGMLKKPRYLLWNAEEALITTIRQLTKHYTGDGFGQYKEGSSPYYAISLYMNHELNRYSSSNQNLGYINFGEINKKINWVLLISWLIIALFLLTTFRKDPSSNLSLFLFLTLSFFILNAFVTGALANVSDRLQDRINWLIPFLALLLILNKIKNSQSSVYLPIKKILNL